MCFKFTKHPLELSVENLDEKTNEFQEKEIKHSELFPNSLRCLILGPSGAGKTNCLISMIEHPNGLKFENLYVFSKSLEQDKYRYLANLMTPIKEIGFETFSNNDEVIDLSDAKRNSIFIFDDVACEKQNPIKQYFCQGRHKGIDSFFLCQSYSNIRKHNIRDNAKFLILFKQDFLNLKNIHRDHIGSDMEFKNFLKLCNHCWKKNEFDFITIAKSFPLNYGRYRKKFDTFISLK